MTTAPQTPDQVRDALRLDATELYAAEEPLVLLAGDLPIDDQLAAALSSLPRAAILITPENAPWAGFGDCRVDDTTEAEKLSDAIRRNPIAAMTLVQLSRAIEHLPLAQALDMESLAFAALQGGAEHLAWHDSCEAEKPVSDSGPAVLLERDGDVLSVILNRPSARNEISVEMRDALVEALQLAVADTSIERVILSGAGKCFSIGGALHEFGAVPDTATGHWVRSLRLPGRWLARCAERVEARVHGACIGAGVELPAFAHRVVAHPRTHFQLPELSMGLIPGAGGCVSIARRIGRQRFNWLALSGRRINARTALQWGLIDAIEE